MYFYYYKNKSIPDRSPRIFMTPIGLAYPVEQA